MACVRLLTLLLLVSWTTGTPTDLTDEEIVQLFQQYIQINSTTGNDLTPAIEFWRNLTSEVNACIQVTEFEVGYPVIVIRFPGQDSTLASIMLNSHMDVVPANEADGWTYPPFSGELVDDVIWGRGTQDMKSVSIQYYNALRRLQANNVTLLRDVYMTLMPDEEIGGPNGINKLLTSELFTNMNVGFALDEGTAYENPYLFLFYQDKVVWQIQVDCYGDATHGSAFPDENSTAVGQCKNVMDRFYEYREEQYDKYLSEGQLNPEVYTSVNLNKMNAGTANNVIPGQASLVFDIRLSTTLNETDFEILLNQWTTEAEKNVTLTFLQKDPQSPATLINSSNPYWVAMQQGATEANITLYPVIPTGSTDARFTRIAGYPAFGFSPMPNTEFLLHSVNERLGKDTFLNGIDVYEKLIPILANIPASQTSNDPSDYIVFTNGV